MNVFGKNPISLIVSNRKLPIDSIEFNQNGLCFIETFMSELRVDQTSLLTTKTKRIINWNFENFPLCLLNNEDVDLSRLVKISC